MNRNYLKLCFIFFTLCTLSSCKEEPGEEKAITTLSAISTHDTSSFQTTLEGRIDGDLLKQEINRGLCEFGFLYISSTNIEGTADGMFNSFKENGQLGTLSKAICNRLDASGNFSCTIENLNSNEEYWFCAYAQSDNSGRHISSPSLFKTNNFTPTFNECLKESIGFFDATLSVSLDINGKDIPACKYGIIYNKVSGSNNQSEKSKIAIEPLDGGVLSVHIKNLLPESTYLFHFYIQERDNFYYSPEQEFSTRNLSELATDLGLSVMWAVCDLDADYNNEGIRVAWGCNTYLQRPWQDNQYNLKWADYIYYSQENDTIANIGNDISGTSYDIAHEKLGGKWRMPTKKEFEELLYSADIHVSKIYEGNYTIGRKFSANGNSISMYNPCWSSTTSDKYNSEKPQYGTNAYAYCMIPAWEGSDSRLIIYPTLRSQQLFIRPVCDY